MKISFVILTINRSKDLRENLNELIRQDHPNVEIIVVDSNSSDDTKDMLAKHFPMVRVVPLHFNGGVTYGRNQGILKAKGDILVFVDDDAVLRDLAAARKVESYFEQDASLGILAFQENNYHKPEDAIQWHFPGKDPLRDGDKEFYTCYFPGAGHAIRRRALHQTGLYPNYYFYATEELDLSTRMLDHNYRILYTPDIKVFHKVELGERKRFKDYFELRNNLWYGMRLLPWPVFVFHAGYKLLQVSAKSFPRYLPNVFLAISHAWQRRHKPLMDRRPVKYSTAMTLFRERILKS